MSESFRRQIVVCAQSWGGGFNSGLFRFHGFADTKIDYFDNSMMKHEVGWFEVVVNNF